MQCAFVHVGPENITMDAIFSAEDTYSVEWYVAWCGFENGLNGDKHVFKRDWTACSKHDTLSGFIVLNILFSVTNSTMTSLSNVQVFMWGPRI